MNSLVRFALRVLLAALFLSSCAPPPQQQPTPLPTAVAPATVPVTAGSLVGDWVRVLASSPDPDRTGHYWLRLDAEGTFALTTNKMQFEKYVNQMGSYSLDGDQLTLSAQASSLECVGESAIYQTKMYEDETVEFLPIDVPCEGWLNMGPGGLGEETLWVRPNE